MRPIVLLLACGLVVGCGQDDVDSGVKEYRDRVEAMCRDAERSGERLANKLGDDADGSLRFFREMLALGRRAQERTERMNPPDELADEHERSIELGRRSIEAIEELVDALESAEHPAAALRREFPPLLRLIDESNDLAREMKLDDCVAEPIVPEPGQRAPS